MIHNKISKDIIINQCAQEDIYLKFLGLTDFPKDMKVSNPFSTKDKNPSMHLYYDKSILKYKGHNESNRAGDVWQFVADLNNLDCQKEFPKVLETIAIKMNIDLQNGNINGNINVNRESNKLTVKENNLVVKDNISANSSITHGNNGNINGEIKVSHESNGIAVKEKNININGNTNENNIVIHDNNGVGNDNYNSAVNNAVKEKETKTLSIETRDFTEDDLKYWSKLGVTKEILELHKVVSISSYTWLGKKPIYTKKGAVAFAFELDGNYKLYIPEQSNLEIKKNVLPPFPSGIFGFEQLGIEKKETILLCEGEKDVIVANSRGFNAVTFGSGSIHPKKEHIEALQAKCKKLLVCYDADETGINGMNNLIKNFPEIIPIYLPKNEKIKGYDITDYFQEHTAHDLQKIIDLAVKNKNVGQEVTENTDLTIFHKAENYISKNYDLRLDVIANEIEISPKDENNWQELNEDHLYVEMQKKHLKISIGNLRAILLSEFVPKFNPIKSYFENLPEWDKKTDFIKQFLDYVELEQGEDKEQFLYQFKKWCVRSVKCSTIEGYYNKQAFVLSDDAKGQNIGKTTYIRFLVPKALNKYYCENLPEDKDALKRLGQNFMINLDELATLSRTDINKLKSMFSSDKIKTRLPYGKKDIVISRVANFIGSTNMSTFLVDESGSVRWLCFIVKKINFNYTTEFNIDNLWSQAYSLSKNEDFKEVMTPEDIRLNELRNDKFQILSPERELIPKYFEVPTVFENAEFLSATGILDHICLWTSNGIRLNTGAIGKALPKCGFTRKKHNGVFGYWVVKKENRNS